MKKAVLKCGVVGGLVVFLWSTFSWMVLPWHEKSFHTFTNENEVQRVIRNNTPESGIYVLPNLYAADAGRYKQEIREQKMQMLQKGPMMFASVRVEGVGKMGAGPMVISLITQIIGASLIAWMLLQTNFKKYGQRVYFVTLVGFLVGLLGLLPAWTWWGFSACYTLILWADLIIGWFLAGLAIAKFSKR